MDRRGVLLGSNHVAASKLGFCQLQQKATELTYYAYSLYAACEWQIATKTLKGLLKYQQTATKEYSLGQLCIIVFLAESQITVMHTGNARLLH